MKSEGSAVTYYKDTQFAKKDKRKNKLKRDKKFKSKKRNKY